MGQAQRCPGSISESEIRSFLFVHLKRCRGDLHYMVRPEIGSSQEEADCSAPVWNLYPGVQSASAQH